MIRLMFLPCHQQEMHQTLVIYFHLLIICKVQGALSNATRGIFGGGYQAAPAGGHNIMQYVTINSNGNAVDFGDLPGSGSFSGVTGGSSTYSWIMVWWYNA